MSSPLSTSADALSPQGIRAWLRGAFTRVLTLLTVGVYALLAPWGYALFALVVLLPTRDPEARRERLQAAMRLGFRSMHGWLRALRLFEVNLPAIDASALPAPCVVIANHPTHLDITAILRWIPRSCTLVKPSIYRRWWLEPLMGGSGQLEGAGPHPLDGARLVERGVQRLRDGQSVVVFPEGTRTERGREMPFHRLGFELACRADVPVVPLRITCDPPYLSKDRPLSRPPRPTPKLTLEVLEPVWPESFGRDSRRLREWARSLYTEHAAQRTTE